MQKKGGTIVAALCKPQYSLMLHLLSSSFLFLASCLLLASC